MESCAALGEPRPLWSLGAALDGILPATVVVRAKQSAALRVRLAILEGAIRDFQRNLAATDERAERYFDDAARWIASTDHVAPFTFENVCGALGLGAALVRANLGRWRARRFVDCARQWLDAHHRAESPGAACGFDRF